MCYFLLALNLFLNFLIGKKGGLSRDKQDIEYMAVAFPSHQVCKKVLQYQILTKVLPLG
jgi:hypothetical protein